MSKYYDGKCVSCTYWQPGYRGKGIYVEGAPCDADRGRLHNATDYCRNWRDGYRKDRDIDDLIYTQNHTRDHKWYHIVTAICYILNMPESHTRECAIKLRDYMETTERGRELLADYDKDGARIGEILKSNYHDTKTRVDTIKEVTKYYDVDLVDFVRCVDNGDMEQAMNEYALFYYSLKMKYRDRLNEYKNSESSLSDKEQGLVDKYIAIWPIVGLEQALTKTIKYNKKYPLYSSREAEILIRLESLTDAQIDSIRKELEDHLVYLVEYVFNDDMEQACSLYSTIEEMMILRLNILQGVIVRKR